jgi:hypothetical protein
MFLYARWTRKGVPAAMSFVDKLQPYVAEWASAADEQNVVTEHRPHDGAAWVAYLQWYLPRMRMRVTYVSATPPPPLVPDHDKILPYATYPVRRNQTADIAVSYDTANVLRSTTCWLISCGSHRPRGSSALPEGFRSTGARTTGSSLLP